MPILQRKFGIVALLLGVGIVLPILQRKFGIVALPLGVEIVSPFFVLLFTTSVKVSKSGIVA